MKEKILSGYLVISFTVVVCTAFGTRSLPNNTDCGKQHYPPHPSKRIVGGKEVLHNSWPWMAALRFDDTLVCGGTLVRNNSGSMVVITAAHCVDGTLSDPTRWEVRLGIHSRLYPASSNYYVTRKVSKIIKHEDFQSFNLQNDIAVLVLDEDVQESNGVSPACVTRQIYWDGENCVSLGWGTTVQGGDVSDKLQEVYKPLLNTSTCYGYLTELFEGTSMLCAGFEDGGSGHCYRDSGGPLLCKRNDQWYLTGIISWSFGCGEPKLPPVYTNVFNYVTTGWLRDNADI